jgi:hypothetical protein
MDRGRVVIGNRCWIGAKAYYSALLLELGGVGLFDDSQNAHSRWRLAHAPSGSAIEYGAISRSDEIAP